MRNKGRLTDANFLALVVGSQFKAIRTLIAQAVLAKMDTVVDVGVDALCTTCTTLIVLHESGTHSKCINKNRLKSFTRTTEMVSVQSEAIFARDALAYPVEVGAVRNVGVGAGWKRKSQKLSFQIAHSK